VRHHFLIRPQAYNVEFPFTTATQTWPISDQWKYHLEKRGEEGETLLVEAMFSIPTRRRPIPNATASANFRLTKVRATAHKGCWLQRLLAFSFSVNPTAPSPCFIPRHVSSLTMFHPHVQLPHNEVDISYTLEGQRFKHRCVCRACSWLWHLKILLHPLKRSWVASFPPLQRPRRLPRQMAARHLGK
jgi:hypothetical protein